MGRSEGSAGVGRHVHVGLGHVGIYGIASVWRRLDNELNWRKCKDCGRKRKGGMTKKLNAQGGQWNECDASETEIYVGSFRFIWKGSELVPQYNSGDSGSLRGYT